MQERLFLDPAEGGPVIDEAHDPYAELRVVASRLTLDYVIEEDEALRVLLAFGSESGARRILRQRWWNGEIEMRGRVEEAEAA